MDGLQARFKSSDIANVEAGSAGEVRISPLGGMSEHYVAVGPLKAAASTSTLSLDLKPSPTSFVRIQLLDKASKGVFVDVDLDAAKVTIQRLEPIGRPTAELTKVDGEWKRVTIKGEFANEDRTIIVQLMKGLGATGFSPGGEGVSVRSMLLY
jgi:hypothetical protein